MGINQSYAVFGLGRYGKAVAKELVDNGAEVLAVDSNEELVNDAIADIPYCKCADITEPEVIKQLGIANIDVVIIAMASSLEASVMATMLCKEIGVKIVIAKCATDMDCKILSKVGADRVVFPESESGIRLAKNLLSSGFVDIMDLSNDVSMIELEVRPETCRELTQKYVSGLSYVSYMVMITDWDSGNVEEILRPCMFEDVYRIHTGEVFVPDGEGIPAELYEVPFVNS